MRSALTDICRISLLAMCLTGCADPLDDGYSVVAVKSRPQEGYDVIEGTRGCIASVIRKIPATRYFRNGEQEEYLISGPIGYKDICK